MAEKEPVKIVLLTGYLGAGKTTLVNHILSNNLGIKAAVIVNDIGEVNVDASLIKDGGLQNTDELIPLTNGCICCSLSNDLTLQLQRLATSGDYDYIIIEASGVCEPMPIAYTISAFCEQGGVAGPLALDNIVAVVDANRMLTEFDSGKDLMRAGIDEDDIEALLIQQIEFCSTLVINKCDLVTDEQLAEIKALVRTLQKDAKIIEATNSNVDVAEILNTGRFSFDGVYGSAAWLQAVEHGEAHKHKHKHKHEHEHEHEHEHDHEHHHHHHDHDTLDYGFQTFVYYRRKPFDINAFSDVVSNWPSNIIRVKGCLWADEDLDMCYLFETAGSQAKLAENGRFVASAPDWERERIIKDNPQIKEDWDDEVGDRMTKLCIIGRHIDPEKITAELDSCLVDFELDF